MKEWPGLEAITGAQTSRREETRCKTGQSTSSETENSSFKKATVPAEGNSLETTL